jgi:hypothetical protein
MASSPFSMHTTRESCNQVFRNAEKLTQIFELISNKSDEITFSSPNRLLFILLFYQSPFKKSGYID